MGLMEAASLRSVPARRAVGTVCIQIDVTPAPSIADICSGKSRYVPEPVRQGLSDSYRKCKVKYWGVGWGGGICSRQ